MVAESFHSLTAEESAAHGRRVLGRQLDVRATPRAQALLLDSEAERAVQERQFDPDTAFGGPLGTPMADILLDASPDARRLRPLAEESGHVLEGREGRGK